MTNLGEVTYLLGWSIQRDRKNRTIFINQHKYATKVLDRFSDYIPYPIATPADRNVKLSLSSQPSSDAEKDAMKDIPYHEAVGSVMYFMVGTRPAMAFYLREVYLIQEWSTGTLPFEVSSTYLALKTMGLFLVGQQISHHRT
ncbi:hypothetical protein PI125_g27113 [Phytophthora idaei]|nr:hypothetical protein PI125_g27113 [Phytophthora idaei]KAG3114416.1 hypothetical protein PI126_g24723 [Phytophthora idaei]